MAIDSGEVVADLHIVLSFNDVDGDTHYMVINEATAREIVIKLTAFGLGD